MFSLLLIAFRSKNQKRKKTCLTAALCCFFIFSNKFIYNEVILLWEPPSSSINQINDTYEVAIILGGFSNFTKEKNSINFHQNGDRLFQILPLYFNGKVKRLMISGGSGHLGDEYKESVEIRDYLVSIGVKEKDILIESKSRNTYQNALFSAEVLAENNINSPVLLSTSAVHMKRSLLCFKKQDIQAVAFVVDPMAKNRDLYPSTFLLPNADVLNDWYWLLHEWIGILSYKLYGYC